MRGRGTPALTGCTAAGAIRCLTVVSYCPSNFRYSRGVHFSAGEYVSCVMSKNSASFIVIVDDERRRDSGGDRKETPAQVAAGGANQNGSFCAATVSAFRFADIQRRAT